MRRRPKSPNPARLSKRRRNMTWNMTVAMSRTTMSWTAMSWMMSWIKAPSAWGLILFAYPQRFLCRVHDRYIHIQPAEIFHFINVLFHPAHVHHSIVLQAAIVATQPNRDGF